MKIGKIPSDVLRRIVYSNITHHRPEVLVRPNIGEDCSVIDFGEYVCVLSTDPITGTTKDIGSLAVHISCNDIASNGVDPLGIMLTILAPPSTTEEELAQVMADANKAAASINVEIIGGHTEISSAVNQMIISGTAIGRQLKGQVVVSKGAQLGDVVIMTKHAGLEGASIIAKELEEKLTTILTSEEIFNAQSFSHDISVVTEGVLAWKIGVSSMHDVTEGGILGAIWELAEASGLGVEVYLDSIPVKAETLKISEFLSLDPYRLISSGVMVMTISEDKLSTLLATLKDSGIDVTVVGKIVSEGRVILKGDERKPLDPPDVDELYKALG
ncbi:AIR synthase [Alkalicella caledoniensis]|uniref:AIR synthase n=1 Tax=Alkalicella caledoniensis TaxID=2731377 RepID=A0A7G9WAW6_ALKCA|nr:AIR synthase family protein [Alkalicella caledoniensis]QNO15828.1 AIR synthase [Alkalicella caledoniensis]